MRRTSKWYKEFTDKDDDPHSPFSIRVNDEEGLAMEKDYTSSASTSSSVSTSSSCYDENEHNVWNPLMELFCHVHIGLSMETQVDEISTARVHSGAIFHSTLHVTRVAVVDLFRSGCRGSSPSLTHLRLHNLCLRRPYRLTNSLAHSLCCTGGKKIALGLSVCVVRPCRKAVSAGDMRASATSALRRRGHQVLREYRFVSCLTMSIMGNSEGCSTLCLRLAATSCKRLPHVQRF